MACTASADYLCEAVKFADTVKPSPHRDSDSSDGGDGGAVADHVVSSDDDVAAAPPAASAATLDGDGDTDEDDDDDAVAAAVKQQQQQQAEEKREFIIVGDVRTPHWRRYELPSRGALPSERMQQRIADQMANEIRRDMGVEEAPIPALKVVIEPSKLQAYIEGQLRDYYDKNPPKMPDVAAAAAGAAPKARSGGTTMTTTTDEERAQRMAAPVAAPEDTTRVYDIWLSFLVDKCNVTNVDRTKSSYDVWRASLDTMRRSASASGTLNVAALGLPTDVVKRYGDAIASYFHQAEVATKLRRKLARRLCRLEDGTACKAVVDKCGGRHVAAAPDAPPTDDDEQHLMDMQNAWVDVSLWPLISDAAREVIDEYEASLVMAELKAIISFAALRVERKLTLQEQVAAVTEAHDRKLDRREQERERALGIVPDAPPQPAPAEGEETAAVAAADGEAEATEAAP